MRTRIGWRTGLLLGVLALSPAVGRAQIDYTISDHDHFPVVLPLYHDRPETGGFYAAAEFLFLRQRVPLHNQVLAVYGYFQGNGAPFPPHTGLFVGSGRTALDTDQMGRSSWSPGWALTAGWRFSDGWSMEATWWHLFGAKYSSSAGGVPPFFSGILGDDVISSAVYNFAPEYGGPPIDSVDFNAAGLGTGYGIWNAADSMSAIFTQRFDQGDLAFRIPVYEDECQRCYFLTGLRFAWIWDGFTWRTIDYGFEVPGGITYPTGATISSPAPNTIIINGQPFTMQPSVGPFNEAIYSNVVSNRMYGAFIGCGYEYYLGKGFAVSIDGRAAALLNIVKERAKYILGDGSTQAKRARSEYTFVPQVQAQINLWWYPIQGVQLRVGYDLLAYFNTIYSPYPVSFNFGVLDPPWEHKFMRLFDGINAGIGFIF